MAEKRTYLSLDEVKAQELRLLKAFASFCDRHGLGYSLIGGTLLGAIRHRGFIPWDDDIDVALSRPDFERLISLVPDFKNETGFDLIGLYGLAPNRSPILKVVDRRIGIQEGKSCEQSFLWMDVIPMDGAPAEEHQVRHLLAKCTRLRNLLFCAVAPQNVGRNKFRKLMAQIVGTSMSLVPSSVCGIARRLCDLARGFEYGSTPYVAGIVWGFYGPGERISLEGFENKVAVEFEGERFMAPACWREYLEGVYGNYMEPPAKEKRVTHDVVAWLID